MRTFRTAIMVCLLALCAGCSPTFGSAAADPVQAVPANTIMNWRFESTDPLSGLDGPGVRRENAQAASNNGGRVRVVEPGAGDSAGAIGFPELCDGETCPRLAVIGPDYPDLDPGGDPFTFGVSVLLRDDELSEDHGSNLVQKGLASEAQWKLQIDSGGDGRPSCVVRGEEGSGSVVVKSSVGVADGTWHRIACRRTATALEVLVDDVLTGSAPVPAGLTIVPVGSPLTIGAKGAGPNNDQFHGVLDDVFFAMG